MSDLISRSELIRKICEIPVNRTEDELLKMQADYWMGLNDKQISIMEVIKDMPIAYDVKKVVENLIESDLLIDQEWCITVEDAVKIVKGGLEE